MRTWIDNHWGTIILIVSAVALAEVFVVAYLSGGGC